MRGTINANVTPVYGRDFLHTVTNLISGANVCVWVTMFQVSLSSQRCGSNVARVIGAIKEAHKRGCDVKVIVHQSLYNKQIGEKNTVLKKELEQSRIPCRAYRGGGTLHMKVILVDERYTVLGSHNMTERAMKSNVEMSVVVDSRQFGLQIASMFRDLWIKSV